MVVLEVPHGKQWKAPNLFLVKAFKKVDWCPWSVLHVFLLSPCSVGLPGAPPPKPSPSSSLLPAAAQAEFLEANLSWLRQPTWVLMPNSPTARCKGAAPESTQGSGTLPLE